MFWAGGDDGNVCPWLGASDYLHYDVSKLAQWETVFEYMTAKGFHLHLFLHEKEIDTAIEGGALGTTTKVYFREMVARFGHHPAITWNLGEELNRRNNSNDPSIAEIKDWANYLRLIDPYDHMIGGHNYNIDLYSDLLGFNNFDVATIQTARLEFDDIPDVTKQWIASSASAGHQWLISHDEQGGGMDATVSDMNEFRQKSLWSTLMTGGWGSEYYLGMTGLDINDFRPFDQAWKQQGYATDFFMSFVPFNNMINDDSLVDNANSHCLYKTANTYLVYLKNGGTTNLNLSGISGDFEVKWFDPRNGGGLLNGSITSVSGGGSRSLGNAPNNTSSDWVVLLTGGTQQGSFTLTVNSGSGDGTYSEGAVVGITADAAAAGYEFDQWIGDTAYISDVNSANADVTMPAADITVSATYKLVDVIDGSVFQQDSGSNGIVSMEAEHFTQKLPGVGSYSGIEWVAQSDSLAAGGEYMVVPDSGINAGASADAPWMDYSVDFVKSGTHYIWLRILTPGGSNDSCKPAYNSSILTVWGLSGYNNWTWKKCPATFNASTGEQLFSICMREDGTQIDKIVLTTSSSYDPSTINSGLGPVESPVQGTTTYSLTVNSGSGDGTYSEGAVIGVTADAAAAGYEFDQWVGDTAYISDVNSANADVTMPAADITVSATYQLVDVSDGSVFQQDSGSNGIVSMEAEHFTQKLPGVGSYSGIEWVAQSDSLAAGGEYMVVPDSGINAGASADAPWMDYSVDFVKSGTHYIWLRILTPGGSNDSCKPAYNSSILTVWGLSGYNNWTWKKCPATFNASTGEQLFSICMREDGTQIDKIVLTTSSSYDPSTINSGLGPVESPVQGTTTYSLTVNSGSGDGSYGEGAVVSISADTPPSGQFFDGWSGDTAYLANLGSANTTVTMPAQDITVTATYAELTISPLAINSGGNLSGSFEADTSYSGGNTYSTGAAIDLSGVSNPAPEAVYQSERYGNFTYMLTGLNANTSYTVRLHLAEVYHTTAGSRVFDVLVNSSLVLNESAASPKLLKLKVDGFSLGGTLCAV